jgi:DNA (cytosine-5)-methyltransferase 1
MMLTVDLFAGFGGFTTGATQAGAKVLWAANHWQTAVDVHSLNHPDTEHVCQDLMLADWSKLPDFDLLTASPACQGHSNASQPRRNEKHEVMRQTAWAVVDCLEVRHPKAFLVENVEQFLKWKLFPIWLQALQALGYHVTTQILQASRCGVPQRRKRVIVAGNLNRAVPIRDLGTEEAPFEPCLETDRPWKQIANAGPDSRQRMLAASALRRRCLVQHVTGHRGTPLHEPIRTITTKMQWCLVDGDQYRFLTPRELARGMGFPDAYVIPEIGATLAIKGLGNAIQPPMARAAVEQMMAAN